MIYEHNLSPAIFSIGPIQPRWYALMYILGFVCLYFLVSKHPRFRQLGKTKDDAMDFLTYAFVGVLAGGRLGYILFYNLQYYLANPAEIIKIWTGGMSFHGGLIGSILAILLFARNRKIPMPTMFDIVALPTPLGLMFGRLGNFINGELWGKPTDGSWGVKFHELVKHTYQTPTGPKTVLGPDTMIGPPRHPTQLYEGALEGLALFTLLWFATYKTKLKPGSIGALFLFGYGCARFAVEFCRLPDDQIGYLYGGWLTMGHVLSFPMIVGGLLMLAYTNRKGAPDYAALAAKKGFVTSNPEPMTEPAAEATEPGAETTAEAEAAETPAGETTEEVRPDSPNP